MKGGGSSQDGRGAPGAVIEIGGDDDGMACAMNLDPLEQIGNVPVTRDDTGIVLTYSTAAWVDMESTRTGRAGSPEAWVDMESSRTRRARLTAAWVDMESSRTGRAESTQR